MTLRNVFCATFEVFIAEEQTLRHGSSPPKFMYSTLYCIFFHVFQRKDFPEWHWRTNQAEHWFQHEDKFSYWRQYHKSQSHQCIAIFLKNLPDFPVTSKDTSLVFALLIKFSELQVSIKAFNSRPLTRIGIVAGYNVDDGKAASVTAEETYFICRLGFERQTLAKCPLSTFLTQSVTSRTKFLVVMRMPFVSTFVARLTMSSTFDNGGINGRSSIIRNASFFLKRGSKCSIIRHASGGNNRVRNCIHICPFQWLF